MNNITSIPVIFSVKNEVLNKDDRFLEVEIDVLHEGLNFNKSIFSKEVVNKNIDTIKNTPILGFIRELPDGKKDFKGHEYIITKTDKDGLTRKYIGSAFGLVPESCNARWIKKMSEDGQERDYLRVDGLLWTKFSDSVDIIMRDIEKPHSMELYPNNIEGYENEDGNFVFTSFNFDGCCILGNSDDIQSAMISSDIKIKDYAVNFTMSDFVKSIQSELINKYNTFTKIVNEESPDNFTGNKIFYEKVNNKLNQGGIKDMENADFTQTILGMFEDISNIVKQQEVMIDRWGDSIPRFYCVDIQDNEVIVVDRKDNYNYYGFSFTLNGDKADIDFTCGNRKKLCYENYEEGVTVPNGAFSFGEHISKIEEDAFFKVNEANKKVTVAENDKIVAETNYSQMKADYDEIKPKYDEYVRADEQRKINELNAQKDAKFAEYEDVLADNTEFTALKERKDELSVKDIERECAVLYVKVNRQKSNFSKVTSTSAIVGVMNDDDNDDTTGYITTKYGNIPVKR